MSGNQALNINTPAVNNAVPTTYAITTHGSDWYFTVCACMTVSFVAVLAMSMTKPRPHRIFHYLSAGLLMVAAIAYFTMGSGLGYVGIYAEFYQPGDTYREIFYVRYIDWVITTPLLLTDLLLTAGIPAPTLLFTIGIDEIMIVTGLVGALISTSYKWGYFCFGCVALFYVLYVLIFEARTSSQKLGKDIGRVYLTTGAWTALLWTLYPIAWGLCEGSNYLHPDSEAIFYGVLDLMAKPVFSFLLLWGHRNIDPARLGLHLSSYEDDENAVRGNKHNKEVPATTGTNGTTTAVPAETV